jgi:hypothetical protein
MHHPFEGVKRPLLVFPGLAEGRGISAHVHLGGDEVAQLLLISQLRLQRCTVNVGHENLHIRCSKLHCAWHARTADSANLHSQCETVGVCQRFCLSLRDA